MVYMHKVLTSFNHSTDLYLNYNVIFCFLSETK